MRSACKWSSVIIAATCCTFAGRLGAVGFTQITTESGVQAVVDEQYASFPDWWLSGLHFVDLDGDGNLDLYLSAHGTDGAVALLNDGHATFARAPANSAYPSNEIHLAYDRLEVGRLDVAFTYVDGGSQWWRNDSTGGIVTLQATGITRDGNSARIQALYDVNGDGRVDWVRSAPPGIVFDFGDGQGGFAENSAALTIDGTDSNNNANFIAADLDGDGRIDLCVMKGGGYDGTEGTTALLFNVSGTQFEDRTTAAGLPADGLVVKGIGDFDGDGSLDLIGIEHLQMPPIIYLNDGHGHFTRHTDLISGVANQSLDYAAWGTAVTADFDNDGVIDILMNGKYYLKLLHGTGGGHFEYMNDNWGIIDSCACSVDDGLAFADLDGDGDLDILGYDEIYPTRTIKLYRNDLPPRHWLRVRPLGLPGNRGAAGAKIRLFAPGTQQLLGYQQVMIYAFQSAQSYYGTTQTERHFGLGDLTSVDVEVEFYPHATVTRRASVSADQTIVIPESDVIFADGFD